ncbi:MAG: hypothetical protein LUD72_07205 [Bacteroidales bacterium]|nr:hypothetical protein [Bacteroidales bacterium]
MDRKYRKLTWDSYGISKQRYKELQAFCRQYPEKKEKISYGLTAVIQDGQPHGNSVGNPTEQQALENLRYSEDVEMIEDCAREADKIIWPYILRSVAYGLPYERIIYDEHNRRIPCGKTDFYAMRRYFYYLLHRRKLGTN